MVKSMARVLSSKSTFGKKVQKILSFFWVKNSKLRPKKITLSYREIFKHGVRMYKLKCLKCKLNDKKVYEGIHRREISKI